MFGWLREWYELRREYSVTPCTSCDNLRMEVERLRQDNARLLDKILAPPEVVKEPEVNTKAMLPLNTSLIPWRVRKEMLEAEDREKAKLLRNAPKSVSVTDLEKEMNIVETEREKANGN